MKNILERQKNEFLNRQMNIPQAKQFINLIMNKWLIDKWLMNEYQKFNLKSRMSYLMILKNLIDFLIKKNNISKKYIFDNTFEFSLLENSDNIRMLHLLFWKDKISQRNKEIFIKNRQDSIIEIFRYVNKKFHREYDIGILKKLFAFNQKYGPYPVQFGLEYNKDLLFTTLKVYLSITFQKFTLEKFGKLFGFSRDFLKKIFQNRQYDSIAIDFLGNGDYKFKFYAISDNQGFLYRIERPARIISIKNYIKMPGGILLNKIPSAFTFEIDKNIKKFIKQQGLKIHYLAKENDVRSFYFR